MHEAGLQGTVAQSRPFGLSVSEVVRYSLRMGAMRAGLGRLGLLPSYTRQRRRSSPGDQDHGGDGEDRVEEPEHGDDALSERLVHNGQRQVRGGVEEHDD
jgi:hypothetical protein